MEEEKISSEGQEEKVELEDQKAQGQPPSSPPPPSPSPPSPPLQETEGFHVDLARMTLNGAIEQQPQSICPLNPSEPHASHAISETQSPDMHAPPSTPQVLHQPIKLEETPSSISPTLSHPAKLEETPCSIPPTLSHPVKLEETPCSVPPTLSHPVKLEETPCSISPTLSHVMGEGRVPLWIKWRGKWQAGLHCSLEDCPVQTIKAMPTYGRKSYIVVFFPISKTFAWTDWQLVCPILEDPEPLAFGTHESGRESVSDLHGARQFMFRKIIAAMLDISDRLPVQAVVDCARDVQFWRDFAKDAARAVSYQELGGLLVILKNMIMPTFIKEKWLQNCVEDWTRQCENADTAASMEKLAKELKKAVVWDEVGKLWDQVEQTSLLSEWATWKENAQCDSFAKPFNPDQSNLGEKDVHGLQDCAGMENYEQQDSKRLKIDAHSSLCESVAGTLVRQGIGTNSYILSLSALDASTANGVSKSNEQAFNESEVHLESSKKGKVSISDNLRDCPSGAICIGTTKYGRRCTHKAKEGSVFCMKHTSKLGSGEDFVSASFMEASSDRKVMQPLIADQENPGKRKRKLGATGIPKFTSSSLKSSKLAFKLTAQASNDTRCVGWCTNGTQCSHRAKVGFSYCEKHLPISLKGQERGCTLEKPQSNQHIVSLPRLKELVNEYIRYRLGQDGAQSSHFSDRWQEIIDAIRSEVDSKLSLAESLCKLISLEMESLKKHFEQEVGDLPKVSSNCVPTSIEQGSCSTVNAEREVAAFEHLSSMELLKQADLNPTSSIPRYRCKLCAQEFVEVHVLGQHWRACHKKEAQQYFRGFSCQHCNLPLNNKKALYRHRNSQHPGMSSQPKSSPLALCNICKGQFMGFEDLWQHVICSHPDQMCVYWPVMPDMKSSLTQWEPSGLEVFDFGKCADCDNTFSTYSALQQHRENSHKISEPRIHMEGLQRSSVTQDELKYKCKVCSLRFRLLPDLGRHHQAEHKSIQFTRFKNIIKEATSSSPLGELNSMAGDEKGRKKLQKLDIRRAPVVNQRAETPIVAEQHPGYSDQRTSNVEDCAGLKIEGLPSNTDIVAAARSACCKNKMYSVLLEKYVLLPDALAFKAASLCNEANLQLEFFHEGYVCPHSCKEVTLVCSQSKLLSDASLTFANGLTSPRKCSQILPDSMHFPKSEDILLDGSHSQLTYSLDVKTTISNNIILCKDLSFGKESVPIPCVIDRDVLGPCGCPMCGDNHSKEPEAVMPWLNFHYVTERTLDPSLGLDTESSGLGCSCQGLQCSPHQCEHVYIFDIDNTDAQDIYGEPMVGRFPYDSHGCIILEEGYLVYECNSICSCHGSCNNRVLQKGVQVKLEVYKTRHKGWAVRAAQPIQRGAFVCEYVGEVLDDCEANKRGERYDKEGCSYLYDIDAHIDIRRRGRPKPFVIDATRYGNVARFINHSCSPNLVNYQVLVESMDCQLAHIGLYATRDINIGEELAYDYRYKLLPGKGCSCHCGAPECRGRLY